MIVAMQPAIRERMTRRPWPVAGVPAGEDHGRTGTYPLPPVVIFISLPATEILRLPSGLAFGLCFFFGLDFAPLL